MAQGSFSRGIEAWAAKSRARLDATVAAVVHEVAERVILRSPIDTGLFRSNWQLGVDSPVLATVKDTGRTAVNGLGEIPAAAGGHRYFISNSLPYALRLEYGFRGEDSLGRHYDQAPMFILGMGMDFGEIVRSAGLKVRSAGNV